MHVVYITAVELGFGHIEFELFFQPSLFRPVFLNVYQNPGRWSSLDNVVNTWEFRIYFVCVDLWVSKAGSRCILMDGFRIVSHSLGTIHCF